MVQGGGVYAYQRACVHVHECVLVSAGAGMRAGVCIVAYACGRLSEYASVCTRVRVSACGHVAILLSHVGLKHVLAASPYLGLSTFTPPYKLAWPATRSTFLALPSSPPPLPPAQQLALLRLPACTACSPAQAGALRAWEPCAFLSATSNNAGQKRNCPCFSRHSHIPCSPECSHPCLACRSTLSGRAQNTSTPACPTTSL